MKFDKKLKCKSATLFVKCYGKIKRVVLSSIAIFEVIVSVCVYAFLVDLISS